MKFFGYALLMISLGCFAQNKTANPCNFKGEHYVLYNNCFSPITFCEITQQTYTSCGSVKNCYGLYVMPGDTFYVNVEDKNQSEAISADISFGGYFPAITNFIFQPIDNNCVPQQAMQISIPLTAVSGSSFQIVCQNTAYVNNPTMQPGAPNPYNIYVGGQKPQFTFALSDFTVCSQMEHTDTTQVSLNEKDEVTNLISVLPNPVINNLEINVCIFQMPIQYKIIGIDACDVKSGQLEASTNHIQLTNLPAGLYFISFSLNSMIFETKKIVVIK